MLHFLWKNGSLLQQRGESAHVKRHSTQWLLTPHVCTLQAEERYSARAYVEGDEAAKKARIWAWLGIVIGTIVLLLVVGGLTAWLVLRFGVTRV